MVSVLCVIHGLSLSDWQFNSLCLFFLKRGRGEMPMEDVIFIRE